MIRNCFAGVDQAVQKYYVKSSGEKPQQVSLLSGCGLWWPGLRPTLGLINGKNSGSQFF